MISAIERSTSLLHHSNHHHLSHLNGNNSASNSTGSSSPSPVSNVLSSANSGASSLLLPSGHHLTSNTGQFNHTHHHHHHHPHAPHHHAHLNHPAHSAAHLNYSHHHHLSHLHSALSIASTVLNSSNNSSSSSSSGVSIGAAFGDTALLGGGGGGASSPSPVSVGGGPLDSTRGSATRKTDTPVSPASGESVPVPPRRQSSSSPLSIISPGDGPHSPALSGKTTLDISSSSRSTKSLNSTGGGVGNSLVRESSQATGIRSLAAPASPLTASSAVGSPASTSTSVERCIAATTVASSASNASMGSVNNNTSYPVTGATSHPHSHSHHHTSLDSSTGRLLSSPVSNSAAVASAYTHAAHPFSSSFYHSPYTADTAAAAAASASYMFAASSAAASSSLYPSLETSSGTWGSTVGIGQTGCYSYDTSSLYTPYGDRYSAAAAAAAGMDSAARRKNATRETTNTLKAWLYEHRKNPYPTKGEKIMLAIITKMTLTQVSTWFANARRRLKKENKMTWEPRNKPSEVTDDIDDDKDSISGSTVCDDSTTNADDTPVSGSNVPESINDVSAGTQQRDNDSNTSSGNKRDCSNIRLSSSSALSPSLLSLKPVDGTSASNQVSINDSSSHSAHLLHPHPLHHTQYSAHLHPSSLAHSQNVPHHLPFEPHTLSHILSSSTSDKSSLSIGRLTSLSSAASAATAGQHTLSSTSNCSSSPSSTLHGPCNSSASSPSSHLSSLNAHANGPSNHLPSHVSIASHLAAAVHHPCYSSHAMAAAHHSVHPSVHSQGSSGHHAHYPSPPGHPHAPFNAAHLTAPQGTHLTQHPHSHHHHSLSTLHPMTSTSPSNASSPSTSPSAICTSSLTSVITSSSTSTSLIPGKDVSSVPTNGAFTYNLRWNHHHHQPTDSPATPFIFM